MNESMINSVGKIDTSGAGGVMQTPATRQAEQQAAAQKAQASRNTQAEEKQPQQEETARSGNSGTMDVHIRFQVNEETKDVTLLVLDRSSEKVLRTIPPDELKKYQGMGLFELFA